MKKNILEFMRRGLVACGFGPLVLAVVYLLMQRSGHLETLTANEVCTGIFSLALIAFIAGGMNMIYQIERLPQMAAILIHGGALYITYLGTYLLNGWLARGITPLLVFSAIFVLGYLVIWAVIFSVIRRRTEQINQVLKKNRNKQYGNV